MAKSINAILLVLAAVLVVPAASYAAGLGTITVRSALGQPLDAEIEVVSLQPGEDFQVRLAGRDAYRDAGIDLSPALQGARFAIEKRDGKTLIRVRTTQPVNDPFFSILVEMQWPTGRLARQYTVLVDPVEYRTASVPASQAAAPSQAPAATPKPTSAPARAAQPAKPVAQAPTPAPATPAPVAAAPATSAVVPAPAAAQTPTAVAVAPVSAPAPAPTLPVVVAASTPVPAQPVVVAAPTPALAPTQPVVAAAQTPAPAPAQPTAEPTAVATPAPAAQSVAAAPEPVPSPAPVTAPAVVAAPTPSAPAPASPIAQATPVTAPQAPASVAPAAPAPTQTVAAPSAQTPVATPAPSASERAPTQQTADASDIYRIKRGDTLGAIARKWKPDGVTYEQMLVGLYHTNRPAFIRDNINLIRAGATLFIPGREDVLAISAADATRQVRMHMAAFNKHRDTTVSAGSGSSGISQAQREVISRRAGVKKSPRAL